MNAPKNTIRAYLSIATGMLCMLTACSKPAADTALWQPGHEYTYKLKLDSRANSGDVPAPLFDLGVTAVLHVRPRAPSERSQWLELALSDVQVQSASGAQHAAQMAKYKTDLQRVYHIELDDQLFKSLKTDGASSPMAVALVRTIASALQVAPAPKDGEAAPYEAKEFDSTGEYVARYRRDESGQVQKEKLRYESLLSVSGTSTKSPVKTSQELPQVKISQQKLQISDGTLQALSLREQVASSLIGSASLTYSNDVSLSLVAKKPNAEAVVAAAGLRHLRADEPFARAPELGDLDAARIGNLTFDVTVTKLEEIAKNYDPTKLVENPSGGAAPGQDDLAAKAVERNRYFTALAAMYRQTPQLIDQALLRIRGGSPAAAWLLNALGASGTARGQAALGELIEDQALAISLRKSAGVSLLQANKPTVQTGQLVERLLDDAQWQKYARYGLGTLSRRLREVGEAAEADRLANVLLTRLQASKDPEVIADLLGGVSNAAYAGALPVVASFLKSETASVRVAALHALRHLSMPEADALVADHVEHDDDVAVRLSAADAAAKRSEPSDVLTRAMENAATHDQEPRVRVATVRVLGAWMPKRPELRKTIESIAQKDTNDSVVLMAKAALAAKTGG